MPSRPFPDHPAGSPEGRDDARTATAGGGDRTRALVASALVALLGVAGPPRAAAQTRVTAGFRDFSFGTSASSTPTGEKPESKLWWNDGSWWGSLFAAGANEYHIFEFDAATEAWTDTGTALDGRRNSKADVLWDQASGELYVVSHVFTTSARTSTASSQWGRLYRYAYDGATRRYTLDPGFPVVVTRGNEETLTIAKDSVRRLWVTYVEAGRVKVNWSRTNDLDWGDPADLPVAAPAIAVSSDDISAVVAFGGSSVGVMWSNQNQATTYFAFRRDTDLPEAWQPIERVLPGPGCAGACADDHLNLKTDQQGRVLVATKTSLTASTAPLAVLAVRSATTPATWTIYPVGLKRDHHTRPIVVIDEQNNRLYVFATSGESGGTIYVKSSSLDEISFEPGLGQPFIQSAADTTINNVTSTRQNVDASTGLLVAASDQNTRFYLHGYLRLAGAPTVPAAPTGLVASVTSGTQVVLTWTDASSDEDAFSVERATGNGPFGLVASVGANSAGYTDTTVLEGTSYAYRVRAGNGAGFSAYSNTATAATPGGGGGVSAPIKDITFEGGALTDPATGADKVSGTVALETTAPLNGRFSARVPNAASAYVEEAFAATDDVYASVYVRLGALPAADARIVLVSTAGTSVGNLVVRTTGRLRLRVDTTTVGLESTPLAPGQLYRIGIRQKRGAAGNAVLEAFLAAGDAPFSTPFASTAAGAWTAAADRVRVGATNPGAIDLVFDDLRLDAAAMPGPAVRQLQAGTPAAGRPSLRSW